MPSHIHPPSIRPIFRIASIPGDGIGTEITEAARRVLDTLTSVSNAFALDFEEFDWCSRLYKERGYYAPPNGIETLKQYDAIYFGAVGWPDVPDHLSLWQMILPIRTTLNQWANIRPTRILRGTTSPLSACAADPSKLDWLIVRENSEGEYSGQGGTTPSTSHAAHTVSTEVAIFTRPGIGRIMHFAFQLARGRRRKHLTLVTKSNAQRHGLVLWDRVFYEIAPQYPDVTTEKMLVDAMTVRMCLRPESLDTIVATNLHADILSDLAAALSGSIGIAPSSNLDPTRGFPSMFEPIHGSAPDIAGKGVANPVGAFWSAAEMVRWLAGGRDKVRGVAGKSAGVEEGVGGGVERNAGADVSGEVEDMPEMVKAADCLMKAIENVTERGVKTRDLGGTSNTKEVTDAVCEEIEDCWNQS